MNTYSLDNAPDDLACERIAEWEHESRDDDDAIAALASFLDESAAPTAPVADIRDIKGQLALLFDRIDNFDTAVPAAGSSDDPWMTAKESAKHARMLSDNGRIANGWRQTLRRAEARGLAHRLGSYSNSEVRVRRSTVDAILEGRINLNDGDPDA
jgi:hypothetical protein